MKRSDRPPDYLIDSIARHVRTLLQLEPTNNREYNAQRLLKKRLKDWKHINKIKTYKQNEND